MANLNATPAGERVHIGFFGQRNVGKSSLVNAITGQALSVVSPIKGTTTDPVRKAMELLPLGPVEVIDTPGYDDSGALGALRVEKTRAILREADVAVLVVSAPTGLTEADQALLDLFAEQHLPCVVAANQFDKTSGAPLPWNLPCPIVPVSATTGHGVHELKECIARLQVPAQSAMPLLADLIQPGDVVLLVTPIDSAAPKGRMILPQQQAMRDVLEAGGINIVIKETELEAALAQLKHPPALVVTDSQAFAYVAQRVPASVPLTSFSILFARYKGFLAQAVQGVRALAELPAGASILIAEGCTHHRQCDDIGTVKLPRWIRAHCGHDFSFQVCAGRDFPSDLTGYAMVLHCGGCMLHARAVQARAALAAEQQVPFSNYGVTIAWLEGILDRCLLHGKL